MSAWRLRRTIYQPSRRHTSFLRIYYTNAIYLLPLNENQHTTFSILYTNPHDGNKHILFDNILHPDKIHTLSESQQRHLVFDFKTYDAIFFWVRHIVFKFQTNDAILFLSLSQGLLPPGHNAFHWTPFFNFGSKIHNVLIQRNSRKLLILNVYRGILCHHRRGYCKIV